MVDVLKHVAAIVALVLIAPWLMFGLGAYMSWVADILWEVLI